MKKTPLFAVIAALAIACSPNTCHIDGTAADLEDGSIVVLIDQMSGQIDSTTVQGGKFSFDSEASVTTIKVVMDPNARQGGAYAEFVPETGNVQITLGEEPEVKAGPITDAYTAFVKKCNEEIYGQFLSGEMTEEEFDSAINEAYRDAYAANKDNILGLMVIQNLAYDCTAAELDELLKDAPEFITSDKSVSAIRESKMKAEETAEGRMFIDFSGTSPAGAQVKLSDYVGQGKYVLVDFWASWCGPCKAEIPNIKNVYEQYGDKGLTVLGVAVWDGDNTASSATMAELGMEWSQIFVGDDRTATDAYGIAGIPHIILFAPDGTIYKRNLRGDDILATVSSVID